MWYGSGNCNSPCVNISCHLQWEKVPDFNVFPVNLHWREDTKFFLACWILIGQFKFPARQPYARRGWGTCAQVMWYATKFLLTNHKTSISTWGVNFCKDHRDKIEVPDLLAVEDLISCKLNNKRKLARLITQYRCYILLQKWYCGELRAVTLFVNKSAMFVEAVFKSTFSFSYVLFVTVVSFYQNPNILCNNHNATVMQLIPPEQIQSWQWT